MVGPDIWFAIWFQARLEQSVERAKNEIDERTEEALLHLAIAEWQRDVRRGYSVSDFDLWLCFHRYGIW